MLDQYIRIVTDNYISIICGLFVVVIVWFAKIFFVSLIDIFNYRKFKGYSGKYYIYHYAPSGRDKIEQGELTIKYRWGKLSTTGKSYTYRYKGKVEIMDGNIYISWFGVRHSERWSFVFYDPLHKEIKKLWGVSSLVNSCSEPVAMTTLLSDKQLTYPEVATEFEQMKHLKPDTILKIPKNDSLFYDNLDGNTLDNIKEFEKQRYEYKNLSKVKEVRN